jgi:RNA polymerase sigma-70 factor, ECF subfamily
MTACAGGDQTALDTLAERILPALRRQPGRAFGSATEDMANDAAVDALLEYAGRPAGFRVSLSVPLDRFLYKVAWRNLADLMDAAKRRRARETTYAQHSHIAYTTRDFADRLPQPVRAQLFKAAVNDAERAALRLLLDVAEPRTRPLATALGVDHLPVSEQQREVKRFKDRLVKKCIRLAGRQP